MELTVPWEEGSDGARERKSLKYLGLVQECREGGWQTWLFPIKGCRGSLAQPVWTVFTGEAADRAPCWLWHKRVEEGWRPGADGQ